MIDKKKQGRRNRINGANFEKRVRKDLEEKDWIVSKWQNQVEFEDVVESIKKQIELTGSGWLNGKVGKLVHAKNMFRGKGIPMQLGSGFPDFIAFQETGDEHDCGYELPGSAGDYRTVYYYQIIGVECKINGSLSKEEKEKCKWLLDNRVFNKIVIASKIKVKNRIVVKYKEFK